MTVRPGLDPITLSVLSSALSGIAEEMGTVLVRSAYSSNIKERRDCSAALFDAHGRMVAQAEHIPVHLGAMPEAVAAVMERDPGPGDVFVVNDPYSGGNHLPDVTMVSPLGTDEERWGYAVTRAHHSDIGGMQPGSMPAGSRDIYSEGLIIPPVRLVEGGRYVGDVLELVLANTRTPRVRRGDFRAQIAANQLAQSRLAELLRRRGRDTVLAALDEVISYTERHTRDAIRRLPDGRYTAASQIEGDGIIDDDIPIRVAVQIADDELTVDFTGTADAVPGNVNLPALGDPVRLLLRPPRAPAGRHPRQCGDVRPSHDPRPPKGSLVNAQRPSAVVAGNVETSQRLADLMLSALAQAADLPADGQGTMNNVNIGGRGWTYYETIGGGQGASAAGPGPSGVHAGMSNTLNTPIEALELEYPMRVERFELAVGSGGSGMHRGGDGIVRSIRVLEPATLSLLTDRRRHRPQGREAVAQAPLDETSATARSCHRRSAGRWTRATSSRSSPWRRWLWSATPAIRWPLMGSSTRPPSTSNGRMARWPPPGGGGGRPVRSALPGGWPRSRS